MKKILVILIFSLIIPASGIAADLPETAQDFFSLGYQSYQQGDYPGAVSYFQEAISLSPNQASAYFFLGKSYYLLNDYANATTALNKVIELKGTHPDSTELLNAISKINRKIFLDLKDVDLTEVLRIFSDETGLNIVAGPDVYGKITLKLKDMSPEAALKYILEANNYTFIKKGNTIKVLPGEGRKTIIEEKNVGGGKTITRTFPVSYLKAEDLAATLKELIGDQAKILMTKGSNTLIVEGSPALVNKAAKILNQIDVTPKAVMVESKIVETKFDVLSDMGINLTEGYPNSAGARDKLQTLGLASQPTATGASGFFYTVTRDRATALLETLSQKTDYKVLSSPKIIAVDKQPAEIIMGSRLGYKVKTVTTTGLIESVEFLDVGTKLVFTPNIKDDNTIILQIHPEISEGSIVNDLPQKNSTETTTTVAIKDGETVILGGLVKEKAQEVNKGIPFLQDIPILGVPFRRTEIITEKREILIFITPYIINKEVLESMPAQIKSAEDKASQVKPSLIF